MKNHNKPAIIFFGTPEFSLPSLNLLIKEGYNLAGVITNPDEPAGRRQILTPPPVKVLGRKHGIPVFQPVKLDITRWSSEIPHADLYIVAAFGKIIPKEIIDLPRHGVLNIHPSLLPRWRGPSPIQYAILQGDAETGVTIIKMDEFMDHGPIVAQRQLGIFNFQFSIFNTTYQELHDALAKLGAELLIETLPKYLRGEIISVPQDDSKVTYSKILKKDDGRVDWKRPAGEIGRLIRAYNPWPGAWTLWPEERAIYRLKIESAEAVAEEPPHGSAGYVWQSETAPLLVKTGKGSLEIKRLTLAGKKPLAAQDFLKGYPQILGQTFI